MKEKKGSARFLRWLWNIVIYILLLILLRIFAVPVILILIWVREKTNPHGAAEGYCLSRTRKRLSWLLWSILLLAIGVALAALFIVGLQQDREYFEMMDYVTLVVSGGGAVVMGISGIYMGYVAVRDTFFPAKSGLADSIRKQLPYPDEAPPVEQLFAMVDKDIEENGRWFDAVAIGREWVLGELVNRIDRIRGIFIVDEIHQHHTQTGIRTHRTLQLVLIDNRWQRNITNFSKPKELQAAAEYLSFHIPGARFGRNEQNREFWYFTEEEQEAFEREFQQKQNRRISEGLLRGMTGTEEGDY
jgi:hypothetical protein